MSGWTPSQNDPGSSPNDSDASSGDQESGEASRQREKFGLPGRGNRNNDRPESPPRSNPQPAPQRPAEPAPPPSAEPAPHQLAEPTPQPSTGPLSQPPAEPAPHAPSQPVSQPPAAPAPQPSAGADSPLPEGQDSRPFTAPAPQPSAGSAPQAFTTTAPQQAFGLQPGQATQPGYTPPPGSAPPQSYETQPGYGNQPGYGTQPGYGSQPGYGYPPGGIYPESPRNRARTWIAIIAGIVAIGVIIAGVSFYILKRSAQQWTLTAPSSVAGLSRDTSSSDQSGFAGEVSTLRSGVTSLPNYGSLKSTVSALYTLGPNQAVGFIGFNGTFNVQVVLKNGPHLKVSKASPGPHGGTAECGQLSPDTLCQWSTPTTVGIIVVIPTTAAASPESIAAANSLMLRIREAVEHSSHGS